MPPLHRLAATLLCIAALVLAGCATGPRLVESEVNSFSALATLPEPATYRIELLPSQQAFAQDFSPIVAQAEQALARVGLVRDEAHARLVVQLGAEGGRVFPREWPYFGGPMGPRFGWGLGMGWGRRWHGGMGMGMGWMRDAPPLLYHRQVTLVMRDAASQQVVFESSATYEEVWTSDPLIYGVLFDQALRGFPQPPQGRRTERTEVLPPN